MIFSQWKNNPKCVDGEKTTLKGIVIKHTSLKKLKRQKDKKTKRQKDKKTKRQKDKKTKSLKD